MRRSKEGETEHTAVGADVLFLDDGVDSVHGAHAVQADRGKSSQSQNHCKSSFIAADSP